MGIKELETFDFVAGCSIVVLVVFVCSVVVLEWVKFAECGCMP